MTDQEIERIEARCKAATEGPWDGSDDEVWATLDCICETIDDETVANADFIAHSRTDIPKLTKEIRRLRSGLENLAQLPVFYVREMALKTLKETK